MNLNIYKNEELLLTAFAEYFIATAQKYIIQNGVFTVVLAGGNSPKKLYELLASPLFSKKIDWTKLFFFFGDERYVPANDEANNALMAQRTLFNPLYISTDTIFKIDTSISPHHAAESYFNAIQNYFNKKHLCFDLIILGLGENSHTASLFPYTDVLTQSHAAVKEVFLEDQKTHRITMTAPLINLAHNVAFLVYGKDKCQAVRNVLKNEKDIQKYPAQLIQPNNGALQWFLDENAASLL